MWFRVVSDAFEADKEMWKEVLSVIGSKIFLLFFSFPISLIEARSISHRLALRVFKLELPKVFEIYGKLIFASFPNGSSKEINEIKKPFGSRDVGELIKYSIEKKSDWSLRKEENGFTGIMLMEFHVGKGK